MGNSKGTFLKQWITFKNEDDLTDLVYSTTNNHYLQGWFEQRGIVNFQNTISHLLEPLLVALKDHDNFDVHFPQRFTANYTLWNTEHQTYWADINEYREHSKLEMKKIYKLLNGIKEGQLKYNIYYDKNDKLFFEETTPPTRQEIINKWLNHTC